MSVLTYLTDSQITDSAAEITGKTLTPPALLATDGSVLVYVVDVDIGAQPNNRANSRLVTSTTDPGTGAVTTITTVTTVSGGNTVTTVTTVVSNPPAAPVTTVVVTKDAAPTESQSVILRNVPIARNNRELVFADAGAAVTLRRSQNGRYEIIGLSNELPGTYTTFEIDLGSFAFGPVRDLTVVSRALTFGELATFGSFGTIPLGAIGIFAGGVLQEIR